MHTKSINLYYKILGKQVMSRNLDKGLSRKIWISWKNEWTRLYTDVNSREIIYCLTSLTPILRHANRKFSTFLRHFAVLSLGCKNKKIQVNIDEGIPKLCTVHTTKFLFVFPIKIFLGWVVLYRV